MIIILITKRQSEIYNLYIKEYKTIKQIATRLNISVQAVYKILKKLKNKGILSRFPQEIKNSEKGGCCHYSTSVSYGKIRLHNEQFKIIPFYKSKDYKINKRIMIDSNTIITYKNCIMIFSNTSFYGKTETEAEHKAQRYWNRFFIRVENDLNVLFLKNRKQNIKRVYAHYAEVNNELAQEAIKTKQKIRFKAEDNKSWLIADFSNKRPELETVHPQTAFIDMQTIRPFFNNLRNDPHILDKILNTINQLAEQNKLTATELNITTKSLNTLITLVSPNKPKETGINRKIPDYIL